MTRQARGGANGEQDMIPKKRQHHHSYDEGTNEPADLIEEETVEVEAELPSEENEPIETIEPDVSDPTAFDGE
jgi:hypothetical protein